MGSGGVAIEVFGVDRLGQRIRQVVLGANPYQLDHTLGEVVYDELESDDDVTDLARGQDLARLT